MSNAVTTGQSRGFIWRMEFGKVDDLRHVDFSFPPDTARSLEVLARQPKEALNIYVGAPVWGAKKWVGSVYPPGTPTKDFLPHYAKQFHCIELNTTHYRIPDEATIERWRSVVPDDFRFCPKIPQVISHQALLQGVEAVTAEFVKRVQGLGGTLGTSFLQLPPHFEPKHFKNLRAWVKLLPPDFKLAVEFRHPSYFNKHSLHPTVAQFLEDHNLAPVITDVAGRRDVLHMSLTSGEVMVRFIGNDLHPSDLQRMGDWVRRIQKWQAAGLKRIYFIVHQPEDTHAPDLIRLLIDELNRVTSLNLRNWTPQLQGTQLSFL